MDQYNRLLDVFDDTVNNTLARHKLKEYKNTTNNNNNNSSLTLVNDNQDSDVKSFDSKLQKHQQQNSSTGGQSILSSIINKADTQVRQITGPPTITTTTTHSNSNNTLHKNGMEKYYT